MYRDPKRIPVKSTDAPPSKRVRRLLGVLGWIALWFSGFVVGWCISYEGMFFPLLYGGGGFLMGFLATRGQINYGDGKFWHDKYFALQRQEKSCGICGATPAENCDAGLHS